MGDAAKPVKHLMPGKFWRRWMLGGWGEPMGDEKEKGEKPSHKYVFDGNDWKQMKVERRNG